MKYVVLKKAYRRVPVRGYTKRTGYVKPHTMGVSKEVSVGAMEVEIFKSQHHLKDFAAVSGSLDKAIGVLNGEFGLIDNRWRFDGRGKLEINVKSFPKGKKVSIKGQYWSGHNQMGDVRHILQIDKRYANTIPHEYAHFIFNDNGWYSRNETLAPMLSIVSDISRDMLKKQIGDEFDGFQKRFKTLIEKFQPGYPYTEASEGMKELFTSLKTFYTSDEFVQQFVGAFELIKKTMNSYTRYFQFGTKMLDYIFKPTEIFARACGTYVNGDYPDSFKFIINNPAFHENVEINCEAISAYKDIVNAWGDKYLKTGIIKSIR